MASSKSLAEYELDRLELIEDLKEDGFEAGFGSKEGGEKHRSDGEYIEKCREYYFPMEHSELFKNIKTSESVLLVTNQHNLLMSCDFMDSEAKAIKEVKQFPKGLEWPIYFEVLVNG